MCNIWEFLLQTVTLAMVAGILHLVKTLMTDKLSPRWQYGVWAVLALRALVPVTSYRTIILPVGLWLEELKHYVEWQLPSPASAHNTGLHAAYTEIFQPIAPEHVLPVLQGRPLTLTDYLFVAYLLGVLVFALWYVVSYVRLRRLLRRGGPVGYETEARLMALRRRYGLPRCRTVAISGIPSPFVCGVLRPILAVPAEYDPDQKVLLHELLHLKHHDALQSVFWCAIRCLHWCNPVLWKYIDRIGNDMEALCDQRVLELLEGEERREYGVLLLTMANDRYARAPGTTSISNGGANIAHRIEAIVRFKKYPKGMGLVSVCMGFVLMMGCLMGSATAVDAAEYSPGPSRDLPKAMAMARIERCDTVAGALDTYAKGILNENGIYIAMTSPLSDHEVLLRRMQESSAEGWYACRLPAGEKLEFMDRDEAYDHFKYGIYELTQQPEGTWNAWLAFGVYGYADENGALVQETNDEGEIMYRTRRVLVPVEVYYSDGWCVREIGPRQYAYSPDFVHEDAVLEGIVPNRTYKVSTQHGDLTVTERRRFVVDQSMAGWHPFGVSGPNGAVDPDGALVSVEVNVEYEYLLRDAQGGIYAMGAGVLPSEHSDVHLPGTFYRGNYKSGSASNGTVWVNELNYSTEQALGMLLRDRYDCTDLPDSGTLYGHRVWIYRDRELLEEITVTKEDLT